MKIRLKTMLAGPGGSYSPGTHDVPEQFARELIEGGYAEALEAPASAKAPVEVAAPEPLTVPETAMVEPSETAVMPRAKGRKPPGKKG